MDEGGSGMPRRRIMAGSGGSGSIPPSGILGLEMPLHQHRHQHQKQQLLSLPAQPREADHRQLPQAIGQIACGTTTFSARGAGRGKQQPTLSSEEEHPRFSDVAAAAAGEATLAKTSFVRTPYPWQRMKWTDSMVRLLIMVVYCVGDDGDVDGGRDPQHNTLGGTAGKGRKAAPSTGQGQGQRQGQGQQQKKSKWKSVSRAMMERGYCVSPQQCEDKFNDLNKRYKRVNDLLGKGKACCAVENQSILDSMDHLSSKAKEEARKLLNSKHLFFREMCAYHNSGGSTTITTTAAAAGGGPLPPTPALMDQAQQQHCFHQVSAAAIMSLGAVRLAGAVDDEVMINRHTKGRQDDEDEADNELAADDSDEYGDADDEEDNEDDDIHYNYKYKHRSRNHTTHEEGDIGDEDVKTGGISGSKRPRRLSFVHLTSSGSSLSLSLSLSSPSSVSTSMRQLRTELMGMTAGGSEQQQQQQRQWLRSRATDLEEQRVGLQSGAFELERQRFKWVRFSSNKERELEGMKLKNERLRLENERMLLLLRQKELELLNDMVPFLSTDAQEQLPQARSKLRLPETLHESLTQPALP